ncbi:23S rRNA (uracil(1939)-C(5))-methyltransferase RlmD [Microbulbifer hydrolyticus]|uniref:23S rRNA (uracil(1939)-C(5))-methyltransferase RlmD n=1 Tax=Microbulbifer hydrolyticus TaxID=48074 RepID=A0A6P1T922_9GAMM|nr:23S rRNA (uracil(1939)-C(5))-methyltransferase RlmD [Microbulbifer hydrolyticus]MBB5210952.1 23S rRNA (uracil1939-C5)-methyltransferase [Microbulbifer hydrolyticus]QHQ38235.1 23S rRNA (uracil(1939)-C(5))-methyltransferase RlmD [Microbulbifer hydrolyticus]
MSSKRPPFKASTKGRKAAPHKRSAKSSSKPSASTPTVAIDALSHEVRGIARLDGKTLFVDNALPGETVKVRYLAHRAKFDEAVATEIIEPAPERQQPPCPHFELCGGCALQHMQPDAQIAAKEKILLDQLQRFAHTSPADVLPPLTSDSVGYRNKARLGTRYVKEAHKKGEGNKPRLVLGFREKRSNNLTDIRECLVMPEAFSRQLPHLHQLIDRCREGRHISHVEVAAGEEAIALVVRHLKPLPESDLQLWLDFVRQQGWHLYLQADDTPHKVWPEDGEERLSYTLPEFGLTMHFHPQDFVQVNFAINRQMVQRAIALLDPQPNERVLDLFCGLGNFTLPLAKRAAEVVGVEGALDLTRRGRENAERNQLNNVQFQAADLTEDFSTSLWARGGFDKILLDPPRTGALEVVRNIAHFGAQRIVYVSCNPATLARDTAELLQRGYRLSKAGVMDMFPHTTHVESIALFERQ